MLKFLQHIFVLFAVCTLTACAAPETRFHVPDTAESKLEAEKQYEFYVQDRLEFLKRLNRVGYDIIRAGAPICGPENTTQAAAIYVTSLSLLKSELHPAMKKLYGITNGMHVEVISTSSAAYKAGLRPFDQIIEINGVAVEQTKDGIIKADERLTKVIDEQGKANIVVGRGNQVIPMVIPGEKACKFPVFMKEDEQINAYADGKHVVVNRGLMRFTKGEDDILATVIAHELAHNVMRHPQKMTENAMAGGILGTLIDIAAASQGVGTDFGRLGAQMGASTYGPDFESEADYVGVYILARAGYDISQAPLMIRKLSTLNDKSITYTSTHPATSARFVALEKAIEEVRVKKAASQPLYPNVVEQ